MIFVNFLLFLSFPFTRTRMAVGKNKVRKIVNLLFKSSIMSTIKCANVVPDLAQSLPELIFASMFSRVTKFHGKYYLADHTY